MSNQYIPAGFESSNRRDYFESDESDDELNDIVYPRLMKPVIEESFASDAFKAKEPISIEEEVIFYEEKGRETPVVIEQPHYLTEMQHFLESNGLSHLEKFFEQQKITYFDLMKFNETDLDELTIDNYGEKLKIWEGIKNAHKRNWQPSRISYLKQKSQISCIEAHVLLCNIANQLKYMNTTFQYIRNHLKNDPELIKRGPEKTNIHTLYEQAGITLDEGNSSLGTLKLLAQEIDDLNVQFDGCKKPSHQFNGSSKATVAEPKPQTQQSMPYPKVALAISGLLTFGALAYFQKGSISSLFSK